MASQKSFKGCVVQLGFSDSSVATKSASLCLWTAQVKELTVSEVKSLIDSTENTKVILVDVRMPEEQQVGQ
jgi:hypothetical protein